MSTHVGAYDTSRMYRSGSHRMQEDTLSIAPPPAEVDRMLRAFEDRSAFVSASLRPAASAVVAYSEYLLASASLPRDQQAMLDMLRRQAQTILWGLSALVAPTEAVSSASCGAGADRAIA